MKFILLVFFLVLGIKESDAQNFDIETYLISPTYETIVAEFCEHYTFSQGLNSNFLRFAKKPNGWHAVIFDYENDKILSEELFWQNGAYISLKNFDTYVDSEAESLKSQLMESGLIVDFKRHPFFGYETWAEDVVNYLEPIETKLNDTLLYGLGRAYSAMATNMATNQFNYKTSAQIIFVQGGNCITTAQEDEIIRLMQKSQFYFRRVLEINKEYCVVVGTIHTKMCNEYMDLFYKLWPLTSIEHAATLVPDNLYSPNVLSEARNYLNSCDSNAIFFSWGDNDTYPLHYLQIKEHLREDVSVINMGMLSLNLWIDAHTRGWNKNSVSYGIPYSFYSQSTSYFPNAGPNLDKHIAVYAIPEEYVNKNNNLESDYIDIPLNNFTIHADMRAKSYLLRSELAALDIIASNPHRPICFSQEEMVKHLGLQKNVQFNGFTYNLIKSRIPETNYDLTKMSIFYKNWYTLEGFEDSTNFLQCNGSYQNALGYYSLYANLLTIYSEMMDNRASFKEVSIIKTQLEFMTKSCWFEIGEDYSSYKKRLDERFDDEFLKRR